MVGKEEQHEDKLVFIHNRFHFLDCLVFYFGVDLLQMKVKGCFGAFFTPSSLTVYKVYDTIPLALEEI